MLIWELLGAIVGAGFASGREISAFFAQHHAWGFAGAILSAVTIVWLANTRLPTAWEHRWPAFLCRALVAAMLTATGGAMLSGAGEIADLTLPFRHAYWIGVTGTLTAAWLMAHRTVVGLAWVSKCLIFVLSILLLAALSVPRIHTSVIRESIPAHAIVHSICYSGFNAALLVPVLQRKEPTEAKTALIAAGVILAVFLTIGNIVFFLHPQILHEPMPFVSLARQLGKTGFYLCGLCLYIAILSTLTACLRGLGKSVCAVAGVVIVSFFGFSKVVEHAYTFIGGGCCLMFMLAKFTNYSRRAFISRKDMI